MEKAKSPLPLIQTPSGLAEIVSDHFRVSFHGCFSSAEFLERGIGAQWICRARQNFQKASEFFTVASRAYAYGATLHFSVLHGHLSQVRVFSQVLDRAHQHRQGVLPGIHKNLALHCI
jgi:hypothetical protein